MNFLIKKTIIFMVIVFVFLLPALVLAVDSSVAQSCPDGDPYCQTENVIVLVFGGPRLIDTFEDPIHENIPHLWNDLRPLGTLNRHFSTAGTAFTYDGIHSILTGATHKLILYGQKPTYPTIFEYYRKYLNKSTESSYLIFSTINGTKDISSISHSIFWPDSSNFAATIVKAKEDKKNTIFDLPHNCDEYVYDSLISTLEEKQPSLVVAPLFDIDMAGHACIWDNYTEQIKEADKIAYDLWQYIQNSSYYKNKTALIIISDHGRTLLNWCGHSNPEDPTTKPVMFLALGPDFKQGEEVYVERNLNDIAPTIGKLLGFELPCAKGNFMSEIMSDNEDNNFNRQIEKSADSSPVIPSSSTIDNIKAKNSFINLIGRSPEFVTDWQMVNFIALGANENSKKISMEERVNIIKDYKIIYGKFPNDKRSWQNIAKIIDQELPITRLLNKERYSIRVFQGIFNKIPKTDEDWLFTHWVTYKFRPLQRDLNKERVAIQQFTNLEYFGYRLPFSPMDWAVVRALAYLK